MNAQPRRDRILQFIIAYKSDFDGNSPSVEEIMAACAISSKSIANYHLRQLAKGGLIRLPERKQARSITVVGGEWRMNRAAK
jgi:SOS-response transcriptional repressor LexA